MRVPTVLKFALWIGQWPLYRHGADPPQTLPYQPFFCGISYLFLLWPFSTSQHFVKDYFFPRARSKVDPRVVIPVQKFLRGFQGDLSGHP